MNSEFGKHRAGRESLYVRILGLRHVRPGSVMCFVLFEGSVLLAVLLSMAELVSWWSVPVLPLVVAVMVKINDVVAGVVSSGNTEPVPARVVGLPPAPGGARKQPAAKTPRRRAPIVRKGESESEPENVRVARRSDARRFS